VLSPNTLRFCCVEQDNKSLEKVKINRWIPIAELRDGKTTELNLVGGLEAADAVIIASLLAVSCDCNPPFFFHPFVPPFRNVHPVITP
jgi:hypothetical protein